LDVNQQLLDNDLQVDVNGGLGLNSRASDFFVGTPIKSLVRYTYRNIEAPSGTSATGNSELMWLLLPKVWGQTRANSDSVYASPIAIQPFATYSINDNWYISNGEAPWAFNWQKKEWLIPMGVRVGRLFSTRKGTWNGYV
jgi:hypothetical protein